MKATNTPSLHENRLHAMMRLLRPQQWIKNFFVFGPVIFGGALFNSEALLAGIAAFFSFSLRRKSVIFSTVNGLMVLMFVLSMLVSLLPVQLRAAEVPSSGYWSTCSVAAVILFYWLLNLAYCARLKQFAIIDVCIVAFGFVLRLFAGGAATGIVLSKWIVLMTFLITLFMSFAKRRDDVLRMEQTGLPPRKNTIRYNSTFINQALTITASVTLVCYIMYTVSPEVIAQFNNDNLYLTSIFVLVGLLRYIQVTVVDKHSGNPTKVILKDHFIQLVVLAWLIAFILIIYVL